MPQSPEGTGGTGFTLEGYVAGFYCAAMLAEAVAAPGIENRTVSRVSVQQRSFGEALDDVIVDFRDQWGNEACLSLQVKLSLTVSNAASNSDFREVIRDSWITFQKPDFRKGIDGDRYGAAVGKIASDKEKGLKQLCDWARESLTLEHFSARFAKDGIASKAHHNIEPECIASKVHRTIKDAIASCLKNVNGRACTESELHQFLAHFVLIRFDFLHEGNVSTSQAINNIQNALAPSDANNAHLVWSEIIRQARSSAGSAGQYDRKRLVHVLSPLVRFRGAISFHRDLEIITELAKSNAGQIQNDICGTRITRNVNLTTPSAARFIQIRGLPGSGKSAVIKQEVENGLTQGPVIFLKAETLEGTNWASYAHSLGISSANTNVESFLVEIEAITKNPTLFIDALDRVETRHQPIIKDLLQKIVASPLLAKWKIVASLRDSGIEILRNWLGRYLDVLQTTPHEIGALNDQEAEMLAQAKPHLRPLLFGAKQIQSIVRRPFFAKILHQNFIATSNSSMPVVRSEIDLLEQWWELGGYDSTGQCAIERQQLLLNLARIRAESLNQPIICSKLPSMAHIDRFLSEGILQHDRKGISVRFTHDIFFEWAFFHVLAEYGSSWITAIQQCGEPPAVARVVELVSQWEYFKGNDWLTSLSTLQNTNLRTQWLRAWLLGPILSPEFNENDSLYTYTVFTYDCKLIAKVLVWFQAEKTTPHPGLHSTNEQMAFRFAWPSDFSAWLHLLVFLIKHLGEIPISIYPEVVRIFHVWQIALADIKNPVSHALLQQCLTWLLSMHPFIESTEGGTAHREWNKIPNVEEFKDNLEELIFLSTKAEPEITGIYLRRVMQLQRIPEDISKNIISFSPILSKALPQLLTDFSLAVYKDELPEEKIRCREQDRRQPHSKHPILFSNDFDSSDWDYLSLNSRLRHFSPPSPLREPFHSLFQAAPQEALRLLRELCNHAMTTWQQLHKYYDKSHGTPIPLVLHFPWGSQTFWGGEKEYLWCRAVREPYILGCGLMALEEWCLGELQNNVSADTLIQAIVGGNSSIAVLGVAAMIALHSVTISDATLPLVTSQRLLIADKIRRIHDHNGAMEMQLFLGQASEKKHIEALKASSAKPVRQYDLQWFLSGLILSSSPLAEKAKAAIQNFPHQLPFEYEEDCHKQYKQLDLTTQANDFVGLLDKKNYKEVLVKESTNCIGFSYITPSTQTPEALAQAVVASKQMDLYGLRHWTEESFKTDTIHEAYTIADAIAVAQSISLDTIQENEEEDKLELGALTGTAAVVLHFRKECTQNDLDWARATLQQAILIQENATSYWNARSVIPWHYGKYIAYGLAAEFREGNERNHAVKELLQLIAHPLECVALQALGVVCKLWDNDPTFTWAGLFLTFSLCHIQTQSFKPGEIISPSEEVKEIIQQVINFYENEDEWITLPPPPPAWIKVDPTKNPRANARRIGRITIPRFGSVCPIEDSEHPADEWSAPPIRWKYEFAEKALKVIPFDDILSSEAKYPFLEFFESLLNWTIQKHTPPWGKAKDQDSPTTNLGTWPSSFGQQLGIIAGLITYDTLRQRFLDPILALEEEICWELLSPFTALYTSVYIYDAATIPPDALSVLKLCLERFLRSAALNHTAPWRKDHSYLQLDIAKSLFFVSVDPPCLSSRYANGDYSEINIVLPIVDQFVRSAGWHNKIMPYFLNLCLRAKEHYPAEAFADQLLTVIEKNADRLQDWHGTYIPGQIAELIQHFAQRETPMEIPLRQKYLRILDVLVDMGDRRSAALQLNEVFREVRLCQDTKQDK